MDAPRDPTKPYASWSSLGCGLVALGFALWVLLSGDVFERIYHTPEDDPLLLASLILGIAGVLASVIAVARREPLRLALLGLGISIAGVLAKFFLVALIVAFAIMLLFAFLEGIG